MATCRVPAALLRPSVAASRRLPPSAHPAAAWSTETPSDHPNLHLHSNTPTSPFRWDACTGGRRSLSRHAALHSSEGVSSLEGLKGMNSQAADESTPEEQRPSVGDGGLPGVPLPAPTHTKVKQAEFVKSSTAIEQCPKLNLAIPEFAVIGRSNVGKSSLINTLTGRTGLAMISKTPGKTRCINHFYINKDLGTKGAWYLVDLPGYGYAKTGMDKRLEWNEFTRDYFLKRESLANVLMLVDASIPPTAIDLSCADWLAESQIPFAVVFTKTDKRKKKTPSPQENMDAFEREMLKTWEYLPPVLATSSETGEGRLELLSYIAQIRELFKQEHL